MPILDIADEEKLKHSTVIIDGVERDDYLIDYIEAYEGFNGKAHYTACVRKADNNKEVG